MDMRSGSPNAPGMSRRNSPSQLEWISGFVLAVAGDLIGRESTPVQICLWVLALILITRYIARLPWARGLGRLKILLVLAVLAIGGAFLYSPIDSVIHPPPPLIFTGVGLQMKHFPEAPATGDLVFANLGVQNTLPRQITVTYYYVNGYNRAWLSDADTVSILRKMYSDLSKTMDNQSPSFLSTLGAYGNAYTSTNLSVQRDVMSTEQEQAFKKGELAYYFIMVAIVDGKKIPYCGYGIMSSGQIVDHSCPPGWD